MLAGAALTLAPLAAAGAADLAPGVYNPDVRYPPPVYAACSVPTSPVILFDRYGRPTVPARTPTSRRSGMTTTQRPSRSRLTQLSTFT